MIDAIPERTDEDVRASFGGNQDGTTYNNANNSSTQGSRTLNKAASSLAFSPYTELKDTAEKLPRNNDSDLGH